MDELSEREWRGNVRELNNQIHRGFILAQDSDEIGTEHINHALFSSVDDSIAKEEMDAADLPLISIQEMELKLIKKALKHTNGNQKKAAELLGISDRTIRNKLKDMQDED